MNLVNEWASTFATLGLIGVTVWYAIQTQAMARSARDSAESSRQAADYSARSAAIAAAGVQVEFNVSPVYSFDSEVEGIPFKGVRIECAGAAVYVHRVVMDEVFSLDPTTENVPSEYTTVETFGEDELPALTGLDEGSVLMHRNEFVFLEFSRSLWKYVEVADLTVAIDYSFDGMPPFRCRKIDWGVYDNAYLADPSAPGTAKRSPGVTGAA